MCRSAGPRLLTLEHGPGSLRLVCDDEVLWYTLDAGPGTLVGLRLACLTGVKDAKPSGGVRVQGVAVELIEPARRRPAVDPGRDELWLASGDQLFGVVRRADADGVEIAGRFGSRTYAWRELRAWYPCRAVAAPRVEGRGVEVRIEIDSGCVPPRTFSSGR